MNISHGSASMESRGIIITLMCAMEVLVFIKNQPNAYSYVIEMRM
jgi:hypothetical protein